MQYHLLIADDENVIRKGLADYVSWEKIGCIMDGTVKNGMEAVEFLKINKPDIVITDIKMPRMDGLELAKYIYENHPKIKVIILTGHAEFEYARRAIQYDVAEYILKPISKDKLMESVKKVIEIINKETEEKQSRLWDTAYLCEKILAEFADNPQDTEKLLIRAAEYDISLKKYHAAAFDAGKGQMKDLKFIREKLSGQYPKDYLFLFNKCLFWLNRGDDRIKLCKTTIEMVNIGKRLYGLFISAGISGPHHGLVELTEAVNEVLFTLHQNFYSGQSVCLYNKKDEIPCLQRSLRHNDIHTICAGELFTMEKNLNERNFHASRKNVEGIFSSLRSFAASEFDVKTVCIQIYYICACALLKNGLSGFPQIADCTHREVSGNNFFLRIHEGRTINSLANEVFGLLTYTEDTLSNHGKYLSIQVKKALRYICDNYQKDLSLEIIACECHINSSHLSRIFKKALNEPISEYINRIRVEKAKELLTVSSLLSYETAEAVGFNDPSYFSKVFKKITGISPKDFKYMNG